MPAKKKEDDALILRFKFDDDGRKTFSLDLADLSTREQVEIEEFFDRPMEACLNDGWLLNSRKGMALLAYIARRRREPEFTYDNALDALDSMVDEEDEKEEKRPTTASKAAGNPS